MLFLIQILVELFLKNLEIAERTFFFTFCQHKDPFPLRAWKRAFFLSFIDSFCARFNFNRSLQSKINERNKKCSFPRS